MSSSENWNHVCLDTGDPFTCPKVSFPSLPSGLNMTRTLFRCFAAAEGRPVKHFTTFSFAQHRRSPRGTSACRYGMTADIRCVFTASPRLFAVDLWQRLAVASLTHLQLSSHSHRLVQSKSKAAALGFLLVSFSCSVEFCYSSLFGSCVSDHMLEVFTYKLLQKGFLALRPPADIRAIRGVFKHTVNNKIRDLSQTSSSMLSVYFSFPVCTLDFDIFFLTTRQSGEHLGLDWMTVAVYLHVVM